MLNIRKVRKIVKAQSGVQFTASWNSMSKSFNPAQQAYSKLGQSTTSESKKSVNLDKASNIASIVGGAADVLGGALFSGQRANDSGLTTGINTAWDTAANAAMMFAPVGTIVGGAMKAGAFIQDGLQAMGGGTDQMTVTDQILDSPLGLIAGVGLINGFGGKKSQNFEVDQETISQVGSSYGGSVSDINAAKEVAGKKYGAFSSSARKRANRQIDEARRQQNIMTNIAEDQADRSAIASSMSQLNNMNYQFNLNGGIDQRYIRAAKDGMKISNKIDLLKSRNINKQFINVDTKMITPVIYEPEDQCGYYQKGGSVNKKKEVNYVITSQEDYPVLYKSFITDVRKYAPNLGKLNPDNYDMFRYWELNGKPLTWNQAQLKDEPMFILEPDGYHAKSIAWNENGEGEWMKSPEHPSYYKEEVWFDGFKINNKGEKVPLEGKEKEKWESFRNKYYLEVRNNKTTYKPKHEDGGSLKTKEEESIEEVSDQKNVIPEGALHAHKHHIENSEGLTQKGIPVVDNEGEQQAEIEKNEIIFNLEVTKKLEEFYEKYNDKDLTQKEKDNIAIEAGKLLVNEILYNTDDRTGLIDTIENEPS